MTEKKWRVEWRLKRTPIKRRHSEWMTKEKAIEAFESLKKQGYRCKIGYLENGLLPMLMLMAAHKWPRFKKNADGEYEIVEERSFDDLKR